MYESRIIQNIASVLATAMMNDLPCVRRSVLTTFMIIIIFFSGKFHFLGVLRETYVNLRKAFDSVNRVAFRRIPPKLFNLISGLYSGTESFVKCDGTIFD